MTDKYPLPSYAVSAWVAGDSLFIAFPGTVSEQGHTIKLPASAGGLLAAVTIMKARSQATDLRLNARGTPTRNEMDEALSSQDKYKAWLKAMGAAKEQSAQERAEAEEFLKELGL